MGHAKSRCGRTTTAAIVGLVFGALLGGGELNAKDMASGIVEPRRLSSAEKLARLDGFSYEARRSSYGSSFAASIIKTDASDTRRRDDDCDDEDALAEFMGDMLFLGLLAFISVEGSDGTHYSFEYGYFRERRDRDFVLNEFDFRTFKRFNLVRGEPEAGSTWGWGGFGMRLGGHNSNDESPGGQQDIQRFWWTLPVGFGIDFGAPSSWMLGPMGAISGVGEFGLVAGSALRVGPTTSPFLVGNEGLGYRFGFEASAGYGIVTAFGHITAEKYRNDTLLERTWGVRIGPPLLNILSLTIGQRQIRLGSVQSDFEFLALTLSFRF